MEALALVFLRVLPVMTCPFEFGGAAVAWAVEGAV